MKELVCVCGRTLKATRWGRVPFHYSPGREEYPYACPGAGGRGAGFNARPKLPIT